MPLRHVWNIYLFTKATDPTQQRLMYSSELPLRVYGDHTQSHLKLVFFQLWVGNRWMHAACLLQQGVPSGQAIKRN